MSAAGSNGTRGSTAAMPPTQSPDQQLAPDQPLTPARSAHNVAILSAAMSVLTAALALTDESPQSPASAVEEIDRAGFARRPALLRRTGLLFAVLDLGAVIGALFAVAVSHSALTLSLTLVAVLLVGNRLDLHRSRLELSALEDLPAYLMMVLIGTSVVVSTGSLDRHVASRADRYVLFGALFLVFLTLSRMLSYTLVRVLRRSRLVSHPVVIVGAGEVGQRLAAAMRAHPEYGLNPVGLIVSGSQDSPRGASLPVLGGIGDLGRVLRQFAVNDVIFAYGSTPDAGMVQVMRACVRTDRQVFVVPRFFELYGADRRSRVEVIWGVPLVRLRRWPLRPGLRWLKRTTDVLVAATGVLLMSPVMALCALAVRLELGKPVILRQPRVGRGGRTFDMLKFRTMRPPAEPASDTWFAAKEDRIGRVGRVLRRTSLDEVPQLINILRGDMSLVGPRPEEPRFVFPFTTSIQRYGDRHRVAMGLTGWAQVNGLRGSYTSIEDRVTFDNYYIENWSFWNDIKILARTLFAVFRHSRTPVRYGVGRPDRCGGGDPQVPEGDVAPHRVLHVSMSSDPDVADVVAGHLAEQLARGWEVTLACRPDSRLHEAATGAGVRVLPLPAHRRLPLTTLADTRRLSVLARAHAPDVVHLHGTRAGLAGRLALRRRVATVFSPYAWPFHAQRGPVRAATVLWERVASRWTDALVCVSEAERAAGVSHGTRADATVIPPGIDTEAIRPADAAERASARARLQLPEVPLAVCIGQLCSHNGQTDLLDAWAQVRSALPGALLALVGDGPDRVALQARLADAGDVRVVAEPADVLDWLAAANVVLLPSRREQLTVVPLQAMARARSVVATDVAGPRGFVPVGTGALVPVGDCGELARQLAKRLIHPTLADVEGRVGREHVVRHQERVHSAAQILDLYESVLHQPDRRRREVTSTQPATRVRTARSSSTMPVNVFAGTLPAGTTRTSSPPTAMIRASSDTAGDAALSTTTS